MKTGARWMTRKSGKRLIRRVIHRVLQGLRDFALPAYRRQAGRPAAPEGAGLKSLRPLSPYG